MCTAFISFQILYAHTCILPICFLQRILWGVIQYSISYNVQWDQVWVKTDNSPPPYIYLSLWNIVKPGGIMSIAYICRMSDWSLGTLLFKCIQFKYDILFEHSFHFGVLISTAFWFFFQREHYDKCVKAKQRMKHLGAMISQKQAQDMSIPENAATLCPQRSEYQWKRLPLKTQL